MSSVSHAANAGIHGAEIDALFMAFLLEDFDHGIVI
jgi:hypothetical protein